MPRAGRPRGRGDATVADMADDRIALPAEQQPRGGQRQPSSHMVEVNNSKYAQLTVAATQHAGRLRRISAQLSRGVLSHGQCSRLSATVAATAARPESAPSDDVALARHEPSDEAEDRTHCAAAYRLASRFGWDTGPYTSSPASRVLPGRVTTHAPFIHTLTVDGS